MKARENPPTTGFVVRLWGMHYDRENGAFREVWAVGWLTKDGACTTDVRNARVYESEADAWTHAASSDVLGRDNERGEWAWVEPREGGTP